MPRWEPKGHQFQDHAFPSLVKESVQEIATEVTLVMRGDTEFVRIGFHSQTQLRTGNLQRNLFFLFLDCRFLSPPVPLVGA